MGWKCQLLDMSGGLRYNGVRQLDRIPDPCLGALDQLDEEATVSTPELEALLQQAIEHVNAGNFKEGRVLLERVLEQDPRNDRAWVWLSGCVEDALQRRICLQQALKVNPNNQVALDGMEVLEGKLVSASELPPSLLESRLSAIGMGDRPMSARPAPVTAPPPSPTAAAVYPVPPAATGLIEEQGSVETDKRRGGGRVLLVVLVVLLLSILVCALVAWQVLPALLQTLLP